MRYRVMVSPWDFGSQNSGSSPDTVAMATCPRGLRSGTATPLLVSSNLTVVLYGLIAQR